MVINIFLLSLVLILLVLTLVMGVYNFSSLIGAYYGAPHLATKSAEVDLILRKINLSDELKYLDIGCGSGGFLVNILSKKKKSTALGIDVSRMMLVFCRLRSIFFGCSNRLTLRFGIIGRIDAIEEVRDTDVIVLYLLPKLMKKLRSEIIKLFKPETLVIARGFGFFDDDRNLISEKGESKIFVYKVSELI
jgi:ribosomal protein L11 methylase PrmA